MVLRVPCDSPYKSAMRRWQKRGASNRRVIGRRLRINRHGLEKSVIEHAASGNKTVSMRAANLEEAESNARTK